ncbi:MAG: hypothetical protein QG622_428, partial [Actinomycetota bacterium]|nr:hypothetical protein [Actinomycetota bacterium]
MSSGIVVDVGGTSTRVAVHRDGILAGTPERFPTPSPRTDPARPADDLREELFDKIADRVRALAAHEPAAGHELGVAFGAVVSDAGIVRDASVLWLCPGTGFDVRAALRARLPRARVKVLNDVSAAAWHYRGLGRFALVTVSTGVAVKAFDASYPPGRRVLVDRDGLGGETGHTVVAPEAVSGLPPGIGRAAADGDATARAELERRGLPWCECGAVADLASFTSGPAV